MIRSIQPHSVFADPFPRNIWAPSPLCPVIGAVNDLLATDKNAEYSQAQSGTHFNALHGLLYVNPLSLQNIAESESTNSPNALSSSWAFRCPESERLRQGRVGIDTLNLMVVDAETRQLLHRISRRRFRRLKKKLATEGIILSKFYFRRKAGSPWIDYGSFKFSLRISEIANHLCYGRHHNSYVASREEACQVFYLLSQVCASEGIHFDYRTLQMIRLDLFRDAVLQELGPSYCQLLKLISRSARLTGGGCYRNGINGYCKRSGWTLYGKGLLLLERAKAGAGGKLSLEELLAERSADEWRPVFRLEMRWYRSASIGDLLAQGQRMSNVPGTGLLAKLDAEPEEEMPRMCVGELLDQWHQLPALYAKTVRYRCLPESTDKVAKGVQRAKARQNSSGQRLRKPVCPRRRWLSNLEAAARKRNVVLDRSFLEALPAYDDPEFAATQGWLLASPLRCLRQYLDSLNFSSDFICYHCKTYRQAEIEYASCKGLNILGLTAELEKAFLLDGDEYAAAPPASSQVPPPVSPLRSPVLLPGMTRTKPTSWQWPGLHLGREVACRKRPSLRQLPRTAFALRGRGRPERSNKLSRVDSGEWRWRLGERRWSRYARSYQADTDGCITPYSYCDYCHTIQLLDNFPRTLPSLTHPPWSPA